MIESKRLDETYVHLRNDEDAATVDVTSTFWDELSGGKRPELEQGRLVTVFHFLFGEAQHGAEVVVVPVELGLRVPYAMWGRDCMRGCCPRWRASTTIQPKPA